MSVTRLKLSPATRTLSLSKLLAVALLPMMSYSYAATTVTSVAPNLGITSGGTTVQINGSGFTGATVVKFGGTNATSFTVISDTIITAGVPAHALGSVSVDVTSPTGTNAANALFNFTTTNQNVQVTVTVTVQKQADIQWGAGTSADDTPAARALTILPFTWVVKDPEFGALNQTQANATYLSNDATNNKTINVSNVSKTNSSETITAITSDSLNWSAGAAPAPNIFSVQAKLAAGAFQPLGTLQSTAVTLTNNLVIGTPQALVIQFSTPTTILPAIAGVQQTITVSLIATAN